MIPHVVKLEKNNPKRLKKNRKTQNEQNESSEVNILKVNHI